MTKTKRSKKTASRNYVLKISMRQVELLSRAAELYARLGMGQFKELERFFWTKPKFLEQAHSHFESLQLIKTGSRNATGIAFADDDCLTLLDLHQVIRHKLAWDHDPNPSTHNVAYNTPRQFSKKEKLASIEASPQAALPG